MSLIASSISVNSDQYKANSKALQDSLDTIKSAAEVAMTGGGEKAKSRHLSKGKILPRERVSRLLDPGSPFLEVGLFAANDLYDGASPCAGMITGIGRVSGHECMIVCNDATVKGGTYYPMTVKNICALRK